ncbi:hypothetical protein TUM4438_45870 [Shewanella sairae]|uniref:HTH marR-type domain-containing protein n=1 Tax=Shewanella sairae TaxID=190310 RepID=A0ABQ4PRX2_9GAMM|nr:hypothetical protein [Shewanella sairae]MCL1132638.1 hypothetical protein [Shewanella sairae]GIU52645.1 hypothetical protein TUM4438_45870 [Shewanella sairae]
MGSKYLEMFFKLDFKHYDLTPTQYFLLSLMASHSDEEGFLDCTLEALGSAANLSRQSVGGSLKKLENSGLIEIDKKTEFGKSNSYFVFPEANLSVYQFINLDINNCSVANKFKQSKWYSPFDDETEDEVDERLFSTYGLDKYKPTAPISQPVEKESLGIVTKTTSPLTPTGVSTKSEVKPPRKPVRSSPRKKKKKR